MSDPASVPNDLSLAFLENLYAEYLDDPARVPEDWRKYFDQLSHSGNGSNGSSQSAPRPRIGPSFRPASLFNAPGGAAKAPEKRAAAGGTTRVRVARAMQERVDQLIRNFRVRGHIVAKIDPLGQQRPDPPEINPAHYGFTDEDLDLPFSTENIPGLDALTLRRIIERLRNTYCRSIGAQFMHIDDLAVREWLQQRMESTENHLKLSRAEQIRILTRLTDAVIFEEFIQKKFIGAKSFSLEGGESLIPLLDMAIERAGMQGVQEIVLGMAHRGRLNVLANIMGKNPRQIFREFDDADADQNMGRGDVKYHLGYSTDWKCASGARVHLSLCFNPSHLEFVNTVALGRLRAKQDRSGDTRFERGMVLLIHGDAAFAGEGAVQETLNLSELRGYKTGGTVHIIVNNQIGFTTDPNDARSSQYATDVAKMLQTPIFHVNGEDPEAVAQCVQLAMDFRKTFQRDVFIDMYCYRRRGHNEGDEPSFTQPALYRSIERRKPVREGYLEHLLKLGGVTAEEADQIAVRRRNHLELELTVARSRSQTMVVPGAGVWAHYHGGPEKRAQEVETGVPRERLQELLEKQTQLPADFHAHTKIERLLETRRQMARDEKPLDWAAAEALAFATLATSGVRIRMSGQDAERGTFSHRHAVLHDVQNGQKYMPLAQLDKNQAPVQIYNSPLSETGVLGFEYGYSLDCPDGLVLWEAQFGDFWNCAQVIVDQFIVSAEDKWRRHSGLVLLLPHGFEGMGPEHSSARLERFLQMFAEDNIQVVNTTTPAQYFHLLRRQVLRKWRKPLIVMTPKSLLRLPDCVSPLDELTQGTFQRVLPDKTVQPESATRLILCTGKIYYELAAKRNDLKRNDVAIIRIEQLAPLTMDALSAALAPYKDGTPALWVQEEPENMGAWRYLRIKLGEKLLNRFPFSGISRPASASPATGSAAAHKAEQKKILDAAFA
ncbi:MAG TPA: 2-oxoglutarate dehydrogenase E1 component [Planctomycetota bacterium]|nr:2-oxoglutarate dehydrogenase E1 component [Planctomycetota bacterium]